MKLIHTLFLIFIFFAVTFNGFSQSKPQASLKEKYKIESTIRGFLNWRREQEKISPGSIIVPTKGGPPDTTTQTRIDTAQVESYIADLRKTGYLSEMLFDYIRDYYWEMDKSLAKAPISRSTDLVEIGGIDVDLLLHTFDTADILDHINNGHLDQCYIIYNKAVARFTISPVIKMLFTLTRINNKWLIDYIGYDNTSMNSIGRE